MKKRFVAIEVDGDLGVHARVAGEYMTICGLDGGLSSEDQRECALPPQPRIDCPACANIVRAARKIRTRDFAPDLAEKLR